MLTSRNYGKPLAAVFCLFFYSFPPLEGLTAEKNRVIFTLVKSCDEDMRFEKFPREEPVGARFCSFSKRYHF
jgi:hypothetical protein